jgi:hypothetical protein
MCQRSHWRRAAELGEVRHGGACSQSSISVHLTIPQREVTGVLPTDNIPQLKNGRKATTSTKPRDESPRPSPLRVGTTTLAASLHQNLRWRYWTGSITHLGAHCTLTCPVNRPYPGPSLEINDIATCSTVVEQQCCLSSRDSCGVRAVQKPSGSSR